MTREIRIQTKQGEVYGQAAGDPLSPLIIGVHGWSKRNGWHTWSPMLQPLGQSGFYAVSVDMPGWGLSPAWREEPMDTAQGVRSILSIIAGLEKEQASIMGKSWGGGIALETAMLHPPLVDKLILSAPAYYEVERLAGLSQPVLLAWSEDDPVIPYRLAHVYTEVIPSIKLITYQHGGHSAGPKNAEHFAPEAIEFLLSS